MRKPVSVTGIERGSRFEAVRSLQYGTDISRSDGKHLAQGTDRRRNSIVGCAQQPAAIFDRSHPCHIQMLSRGAIPPIPAVIRDVDEQLRSILREPQHFIRKNRFVADEGPHSMIVHTQYVALIAAG